MLLHALKHARDDPKRELETESAGSANPTLQACTPTAKGSKILTDCSKCSDASVCCAPAEWCATAQDGPKGGDVYPGVK